ncbi:MAG: pilus assembly PilX N-terminal domain-containing protein [Myxococcales bacterium]
MVSSTLSEAQSQRWLRGHRPRRQAQRGAAVFMVVMVLTILTAIGIVAVRATSLADAAAGYDREGAQAALIAQYGITATTAYMATNRGGTILNQFALSETQATPPVCEANVIANPGASPLPHPGCYRFQMSELQTSFTQESSETVFAPGNLPSAPAGSTSSLTSSENTNALFVVELTEGAKTGVPKEGRSTNDTSVMLTMTAIAQVRPVAAAASNSCIASQGQQVMRAMITAEKAPGL